MNTSRARQADLAEQRVEQPPRLADERQALLVLVGAGRLADEHQVGVRVARAEHDLGPRGGQLRALRAGLRLLPDRLELFAPGLRRGHAVTIPPASAGSGGDPAVCALYTPPSTSRYLMRELDRIPTPHSRSSARAASAPPSPPPCARPASRSTARSAAARARRAPTPCCCACPTRRSAPRRRPSTPGVPVGHCSGATGLDVLTGHEAFAFHPLMTVPAHGEPVFAGAGAAVAGSTPRALAVARGARRRGSACARRPSPTRTAPPTTRPPRSRRTSSSRSRARPSGWRRTAGVDRELLAPLVRAAVENWARLGAADALTGPDRARRRGDGRAPAGGGRGARARAPRRCSTRWPRRRARSRPSPERRAMRTLRTIADGPRARRGGAPRRPLASASCRRWARSTPATRR